MNADKSYAELCERIVRVLQKERERKNVSKYLLEQRSGVSQQMIGYVERGLRKPSLETALRMAEGLEMTLEEVIQMARHQVKKRNRSVVK